MRRSCRGSTRTTAISAPASGNPSSITEADGIVATFKINEGPRFKVGKVDFSGDLILPKDQLLPKIKIDKEPFFNREVLRNDVLALTDLYANDGYAYVDVSPLVDQNAETLLANITFKIDKGKQVYFEQIQITGNTKTRDKVIRRELRVYEQELYGGQRLKSGIRNLNRLDYFKDVKMDTAKGSADDQMKATVGVTEKSTGAFTVGAGYSTAENGFVTGSRLRTQPLRPRPDPGPARHAGRQDPALQHELYGALAI